jgi:hypothetical protein
MSPERSVTYVCGPINFKNLGTTGFEPATYCSQSSRATKLRHVPFYRIFRQSQSGKPNQPLKYNMS